MPLGIVRLLGSYAVTPNSKRIDATVLGQFPERLFCFSRYFSFGLPRIDDAIRTNARVNECPKIIILSGPQFLDNILNSNGSSESIIFVASPVLCVAYYNVNGISLFNKARVFLPERLDQLVIPNLIRECRVAVEAKCVPCFSIY